MTDLESSRRFCVSRLVRPPELFARGPHFMHDHGVLAGDGHARLAKAAARGKPHAPGFERRLFLAVDQQRVGGFIQIGPDEGIPTLGNAAIPISLTRLVALRREAEIRAYTSRLPELVGIVDRRNLPRNGTPDVMGTVNGPQLQFALGGELKTDGTVTTTAIPNWVDANQKLGQKAQSGTQLARGLTKPQRNVASTRRLR